MTPRTARRQAVRPASPPAAVRGEDARRRGSLVPLDCWRDAYRSALTTVGFLASLVAVWCALLGVAALTRPLGLLLFHLSQGGHL